MSNDVEGLADKVAEMMVGRRRPLSVSVQKISGDNAMGLLLALKRRGFKADVSTAIMGKRDDNGGIESLTPETVIVVRPKSRRSGATP